MPSRPPMLRADGAGVLDLVTFSRGHDRFGLETRFVREVARNPAVTRLPGLPDYVAGVTERRGVLVPVFDLVCLFGLGRGPMDALVLLGEETLEMGIVADAIHEVATVAEAAIREPVVGVDEALGPHMVGITDAALIVLHGEAILHNPRLWIA